MVKSLIRHIVPFFFILGCAETSLKKNFNSEKAFMEFEKLFLATYAYADKPEFDTTDLLKKYKIQLVQSNSIQEFRDNIQFFLRHFCDPHLNLGPYNEFDFSVIPTGSDIWAVTKEDKFFISDVKRNSLAFKAKVLPGDEIIEIDGEPPRNGIENALGEKTEKLSKKQIEYGLNVALAGLRYKSRVLKLRRSGEILIKEMSSTYSESKQAKKVFFKRIKDIGYIRFNNSLGEEETVSAFKTALSQLLTTKGLIIDLRDIPSGGHTGVAEPILGHFTSSPQPYQKYRVQTSHESYKKAALRIAYTRPSKPLYQKPYVVLVGRWTGSMGEGMAIGFDAIGAQSIIGSPMADLLGGITKVEFKESESWLEVGFERLYHVNGSFREDFVPDTLVVPSDTDSEGRDPSLRKALQVLSARP
jgi:carboxyl-terminal processing protease